MVVLHTTPEYILDYGDKTIPSDLSNIDVDFNYIYEFNHSINNIYGNDQFFFFQFNNKKFTKAVVLNKKSGECAYVKTYRDNKNGMKLKLISTKGKHNYLVSLIDAADFNEDYNKEFNSKKNKITPVQEEMHKTLKPTDNPALILYEGLVMP